MTGGGGVQGYIKIVYRGVTDSVDCEQPQGLYRCYCDARLYVIGVRHPECYDTYKKIKDGMRGEDIQRIGREGMKGGFCIYLY